MTDETKSCDDMDDVLVEVVKHGIRSPYNHHSFRGSLILLPCICSSCQRTIYPLITSAVYCIRCQIVAHRGICMRNPKVLCPGVNHKCDQKFSLGKESCTVNRIDDTSIQQENSIPIVFQSEEEDQIFEDYEDKSEKEGFTLPIRESTLIPRPGSTDCIWRRKLQSLADEQTEITKVGEESQFPSSSLIDDNFFIALDLKMKMVLGNNLSFPGIVCSTLHSMYLEMKFDCNRDTLLHARECLDAVACAILSILPENIASNHQVEVSNIVDRYVLGLAHHAMYAKVFLAAQLVSVVNDEKLFSICMQKNLKVNDVEYDSDDIVSAYSDSTTAILLKTAELISPRDKLQQLKKAMQIISNSIPSEDHSLEKLSRISSKETKSSPEINRTMSPTEFEKTKQSAIDADTLIELVSKNLYKSQYNKKLKDHENNIIFWFAECTYIESMMREGDWALGIESYSLATVMQSLQYIIQ